jgi:membrane associated rhomboid family serine protease
VIPLRDNVPSRTTPVVNYCLMILCGLVFLMQANDADGLLTLHFGMIPQRISQPEKPVVIEQHRIVRTPFGMQEVTARTEVPPSPIPAWMTALTCVFLHGSVMHLLGNMWFLYIFGDNVEDRLGHWGYLIFYLACGVAASVSHYAFEVNSPIPTIGASGAVAGVMGAYLFLYPHANVVTLVPIIFLLQLMVIPAPIFLGLWFLIQLLQGTFSIGATEATGVAWWAHIGGFAIGFVFAWMLGKVGKTQPGVVVVRPGTDRRFGQIRTPWDS